MRGADLVVVEVLRTVPLGLVVVQRVASALQVDDAGAAHGHQLELVLHGIVVPTAAAAALPLLVHRHQLPEEVLAGVPSG